MKELTQLKLPWTHGLYDKEFDVVRHANMIFDCEGSAIASFYGLPMNCGLNEFEHEPQYADPLAQIRAVVEAINATRLEGSRG